MSDSKKTAEVISMSDSLNNNFEDEWKIEISEWLESLEAVKEYHDCLKKDGITPKIELEEDQKITETVLLDDAP